MSVETDHVQEEPNWLELLARTGSKMTTRIRELISNNYSLDEAALQATHEYNGEDAQQVKIRVQQLRIEGQLGAYQAMLHAFKEMDAKDRREQEWINSQPFGTIEID